MRVDVVARQISLIARRVIGCHLSQERMVFKLHVDDVAGEICLALPKNVHGDVVGGVQAQRLVAAVLDVAAQVEIESTV